jgi:hypothetical protein
MVGKTRSPETKYAINTDGPVIAAAIPGNRKNPELNMAPVAMAYTSHNPSCFSSFSCCILFQIETVYKI